MRIDILCELLTKNDYLKEKFYDTKIAKASCHILFVRSIRATAIYTPMQAYLAAKAGADYAAPYVNRIDNLGADGVATTKKMQDIYATNNLQTKILAAGFKNSQQVQELCEYGISCMTIASDVIDNLIKNANVTLAVNDFVADFESLCGEGKTMLNCDE